jgi:predicted membrane-bound spermidine synthase
MKALLVIPAWYDFSMINFKKIRDYDLEFVNFVTGGVILTFELVASRIITPYIGGTIYTWTSIIGVILAALATGYWYGGKLADERHKKSDIVLLLIAAAFLILVVNLFKDKVLTIISGINWPLQWQAFIAGVILFAAPTAVLGAISPYLTRLSITDIKTSGQRVARMNTWGTIGSLCGTFLTGYVTFGYMGTKMVIFSLTIALLLVSFVISFRDFSKSKEYSRTPTLITRG